MTDLLEVPTARRPKTINDLGFRNFILDKDGKVISSNSEQCPPAFGIPFEDFIMSKEPGKPTKLVPYSGHQIANGIMSRIEEFVPDAKRSWGNVYVYRDTMRHPGYVTKMTREVSNSKMLTPDVSITDLVFERFIGTVDILGTGDHSMRLAMKYEPNSFEMALGLNVRVCQNFNIFGGKRMSTERGIGYDQLMENLEQWLRNAEAEFGYDMQTIHKLEAAEIDVHHSNELLGELMQSYHSGKQVLQLTDISALSKRLIENNGAKTMWDFIQSGTEVLRFDDNSGANILETIEKFNKFTLDKIQSN